MPKVSRFAKRGDYNPYNKWNTTHGIVHLIQPNNTLFAEINLAAGGTVLRKNTADQLIEDTLRLICCSGYGNPNRSSDPTIGATVNDLTRQGLSVTLLNPIGLYLNYIDLSGFEGPNGEDVSDCWHIVPGRGVEAPPPGPPKTAGMILRAEFRAGPVHNFRVDQVKVDGACIKYGGQVADKIHMVLTGKAHNFNLQPLVPEPCEYHCCLSPENRNFLQVLKRKDSCKILTPSNTPPEKQWKEAFKDLVEAPPPPSPAPNLPLTPAATPVFGAAPAHGTLTVAPLAAKYFAAEILLAGEPRATEIDTDVLRQAKQRFIIGHSRR